MISSKARLIGSGVLGSLFIGVIWLSLTEPGSSEKSPEQAEAKEVGAQAPASSVSEKMPPTDPAPTLAPTKPLVAEQVTAPSVVFKEFAHRTEISRFAHLAQKALLLPTDHITRKNLLKDTALLQSLEPLLTNASQDSEDQQLQNASLDLLFAALQSDSRDVAIGVLKNVVAHAGVENSSLPQSERQQLAGIKAEVLMTLSADPKFQEDIQALFPGPVTGNIWNNVQERQESNLAESNLSK